MASTPTSNMFGLQPPRHTPTLPRADLASALGQGSEGGQVQPIDASGDDDSFRVGERYRARPLGRSIWAAMCVAVCGSRERRLVQRPEDAEPLCHHR